MKIRSPFHLLWILLFLAPVAVAQGGPGNGGGGGGGQGLLDRYLASLPLQVVDVVERADLEHMRQEEKLARDVYLALFQAHGTPAFANIADSEQSHMDLVAAMLVRYGIADPLPSDQPGVYRDQAFQDLYVMLVSFGRLSPLHAEVVGALVEDLDIVDLQHAIARTDNRDLATVWQNLARGSRNHLRSFDGLLGLRGFHWFGVFLTQAEVDAIVTAPRETVPVDENGVPLR